MQTGPSRSHSEKSPQIGRHGGQTASATAWTGGILEGSGWGVPKGMHWRTYERPDDIHHAFTHTVNPAFIARFGMSWEKTSF